MKQLKQIFTNVKLIVGTIITLASLFTVIWTIDDRYVKSDELAETEDRIIDEVRSEAAELRVTFIKEMESRLDEYDYEIRIKEDNGEVVPEALQIKRRMLHRRIQRLKNGETTQ